MDAAEITRRLFDRYSGRRGEWAAFAEVRDATGYAAKRTIDFFAVNCWPSKGGLYVAVEIKVSRSDFQRELDNPSKRKPWEDMATETWFATPKGLVDPSELPEGWGLLECRGDGVRAKRKAMQRSNDGPDPWLWKSLLRRGAEVAQDAVRAEEPYATLRGREVSIEDLRRLAEWLHGRLSDEHAVKRKAQELRAEKVRKHDDYWRPRKQVVQEAERLAAAVNPDIRSWRADPQEVAAALRSIRAVASPDRIAAALREAADAIDGARDGDPAQVVRGGVA